MEFLFDFAGTGPLAVIVGIVILVLIAALVASRYKVAGANEALIISGARGNKVRNERGELTGEASTADKGIKVVVGGGTVVLPLVHKVGKLKLDARQIGIMLTDAVTTQGIGVKVQGVATFKIGRDIESIRNAAERFLETKPEEVDSIVKNVLEGSLRAIVGTLTVEELIRDRQKLLAQVQEAAKGDLETSGLQIDSFTIQSLEDNRDYITELGRVDLAKVQMLAAVAEANASQETAIKQAEAQQVIINADQEVALRKAAADVQTEAAAAKASQAAPLAQAEAEQEVTRKRTELAQLEAQRIEQELVAKTIRPAEAEAEAAIRRADGERQAAIARAQASAETVRLAGEAEAAATKATGEAEAAALSAKAAAYREFDEAAVLETIMSKLPAIIAAAAEPMKSIDTLTVLSGDGASEVVRTGTRTATEAMATIKGLTGLDVSDMIGRAVGNRSGSAAKRIDSGESQTSTKSEIKADTKSDSAASSTHKPFAPGTGSSAPAATSATAPADTAASAATPVDGRRTRHAGSARRPSLSARVREMGATLSGSQRRLLAQVAADSGFGSMSLADLFNVEAVPSSLRDKLAVLGNEFNLEQITVAQVASLLNEQES